VACTLCVILNLRKNREVTIKLRGFRPSAHVIKRIYSVGLPSIVMVAISSVMVFGVNKILLGFTSTAAAVFGVYFKLQSFVFMPVYGLNNGMVPIVAYNYGAKRPERITKTIKLSIIYAVSIMCIGALIFHLLPDKLLLLFNASPDMLGIGEPALRIISLSFLFAGFSVVCGSVFQALGDGMKSLIVSVARQLVVLLPVAYLLSLTGVLNDVWFAFPIAEVASLTLSAVFLRRIYLSKVKMLGVAAE